MNINYFMNGFKSNENCYHVCTKEYEHCKNVYILAKDKVFGISFVELSAIRTLVKIAEIVPDFPVSEIAYKEIPVYDWTPINYWCRPGEEKSYLENLAAVFDIQQQLSLQIALQQLIPEEFVAPESPQLDLVVA